MQQVPKNVCAIRNKECDIISLLGVKEEKENEHTLMIDADKTKTKL